MHKLIYILIKYLYALDPIFFSEKKKLICISFLLINIVVFLLIFFFSRFTFKTMILKQITKFKLDLH